jgi:hypothetical protein
MTAEQEARDLMEKCGWEDAQSCSAGEVVFLANRLRDDRVEIRRLRELVANFVAAWDNFQEADDSVSDILIAQKVLRASVKVARRALKEQQ